MENEQILDNDYLSEMELSVNGTVRNHLQTTAKWGKFLGILGFIFTGLLVIGSLIMGTMLSSFGGSELGGIFALGSGMLTFVYILLAAVYFIPSLFLYNFSTSTQRSLRSNEQMDFEKAFHNLSRLYQFFGIFTVVIISFYAFAIVITLFAG
jgi:hypothetical protein